MQHSQDRSGEYVGDYRLLRRLGLGTFGEVYQAEDRRSHRPVAVKLLKTPLTHREDLKAFFNEARSFRLRHPHIVPLLDFGLSEQDLPFLVMEYMEGETLRDHYPKGCQVPLAVVVELTGQLASALQYAHDQHVVHRDVKPENMLCRADGSVLLGDFGIASVAHASSSLNVYEGVGGTLPYMAPEQIAGKPRRESDQYALSVVVYEWLAGRRPFQGTVPELISQHLQEPPPSLLDQVPTLPEAVEQVVFKALAKAPQDRFGSVDDFAHALEQASQVTPLEAEPETVAPGSETTETNQSQQPTEMATVPGLPLSQQTLSEGSANLLPQTEAERRRAERERAPQAQEQADKLEEERVRKAQEEEQARKTEEKDFHTIEEQASSQHRQTVLPTTSPHEAIPPLRPDSLLLDGLPQTAIPAKTPATLLPSPTLGRTRRRRSPAVIAVFILLAVILLGGASFGVYGAVTGNWPWNASPWNVQTLPHSGYFNGVAWSGSEFVAVGSPGGPILTSPDGRTWSAQNSGTSAKLSSVVWSGSLFVVVGAPFHTPSTIGTIITSPDGRTWTTQNSGTSQGLFGVAWSGSQFVAVGDIGTIITSPDGRTWTTQNSGTSQGLFGVAWSGSQFVAVGDSGTILTSPDGRTWTTQSSGTTQGLWGVVWAGSQFVAVGDSGTILTSPDGRTWSVQNSGTSATLYGVAWVSSQFVVVGADTILTSP